MGAGVGFGQTVGFTAGSEDVLGYKEAMITINQTGINAPTISVKKNTLGGNFSGSYIAVGDYELTMVGGFPVGTFIQVSYGQCAATASVRCYRATDDTLSLVSHLAGVLANGVINEVTIRIVV